MTNQTPFSLETVVIKLETSVLGTHSTDEGSHDLIKRKLRLTSTCPDKLVELWTGNRIISGLISERSEAFSVFELPQIH